MVRAIGTAGELRRSAEMKVLIAGIANRPAAILGIKVGDSLLGGGSLLLFRHDNITR